MSKTSIHNLNGEVVTTTVALGTEQFDKFRPNITWEIFNTADYPYAVDLHMKERQVGPYVFRDWQRYLYTGTTTSTALVSSSPGQILSGSDMWLSGNVLNSDSHILAGDALDITGATLTNQNTQGTLITTYSGTGIDHDYDGHKSCGSSGGCYKLRSYDYSPAPKGGSHCRR